MKETDRPSAYAAQGEEREDGDPLMHLAIAGFGGDILSSAWHPSLNQDAAGLAAERINKLLLDQPAPEDAAEQRRMAAKAMRRARATLLEAAACIDTALVSEIGGISPEAPPRP